nr:reverse transcriptase domain-containing protein [Tanacetum cinerariifolium]
MTAILKQFQATPPPAFVKAVEEICVTCGGAHPYYQCLAAGGNTFSKLWENIQGYVSAAAVNYNQGNSGYRPPEEDERVDGTLTDQDLTEYTIKVPPPLVQKPKPPYQRNFVMHQRDPLHPNIPYPSRMHKQKQQEKDELGLPELISTRMTFELANRAICTPTGIARDVFVPVGKFTFPADFVIFDDESDPRVPLILERPFLLTARALIDVHGEEMILRDDDERLTLNMRHETSSYSKQPQKESINMINIFNDSSKDFLKKFICNKSSKCTTSSSSPNHLLEEFANELALITFPTGNDDLPFDVGSDLKEIKYFLNNDPIKEMDHILENSVDEDNLADLNNNLVDIMPEMFTDEHALDYSSPPLYDEYDNGLFEVESDIEYVYDDPFDSKGEKIKESKLLIDELDLPRLNKNVKKIAISHASLILEDFDPLLYELPFLKEVPGFKSLLSSSSENEEKNSNPGF